MATNVKPLSRQAQCAPTQQTRLRCRRKLRFYFLTDEREPRVPYDKRKRKRFVKRFPLSDYSAATNWVEAAMLAGYTPGIQGTEISFVPPSTVEACRWIASKRERALDTEPPTFVDPAMRALGWRD